jgi:hypothetical protein
VYAVELKMAVALVSVIQLVGVRDLGQERAWVFGQGVEEDSVNDDGSGLRAYQSVSHSLTSRAAARRYSDNITSAWARQDNGEMS